jgi:hypothetical protein
MERSSCNIEVPITKERRREGFEALTTEDVTCQSNGLTGLPVVVKPKTGTAFRAILSLAVLLGTSHTPRRFIDTIHIHRRPKEGSVKPCGIARNLRFPTAVKLESKSHNCTRLVVAYCNRLLS